MPITRTLMALLIVAAPLQLVAQENDIGDIDMGALNSAIAAQRQVSEAQRQLIVAENLTLTESESLDFWPLYREYRAQVAKLEDRSVAVITQFAREYSTLGDEQALRLLNDSLKIDLDHEKLKQRYVKKFAKIVPGVMVGRFMQIEMRLDTIARLKLQTAIPLAM
ncbi:MAG: hypothetical protein OEW68_04455 [Gammaproteobacteria bacterium]|nr:hypothetical protein [Gammaproteobacteria bacterium]MDH4314075.1 hypothetical protein [Gammaproteobacteria bacterium]MDH5213118.1 hypothetical protein [Gammaproteobacteria bacterium]